MRKLAAPADAPSVAGDLLALAAAIVSALEGRHPGYAAALAGRMSDKALELRARLVAAECGMSHVSELVEVELGRLRREGAE
jgi:hypothetical protein